LADEFTQVKSFVFEKKVRGEEGTSETQGGERLTATDGTDRCARGMRECGRPWLRMPQSRISGKEIVRA
jgi:hypothetical protein